MLRLLKNLFPRSPVRFGKIDNSRIKTTRIKNAQFISYISQSDNLRSRRYTDSLDTRLQHRHLFRLLAITAAACAFAWIVLESARALAIF